MNIRNRFEKKRGCGFRKEDGFYLMFGGRPAPCGFLPIDIPGEVNWSRGPQWIDCRWVVNEWEEDYDEEGRPETIYTGEKRQCGSVGGCGRCWMKKVGEDWPALLIWVGMGYYKTAGLFMKETERLGVSRRIPRPMVKKVMRLKKEMGHFPPAFLGMKAAEQYVNEDGEVIGESKIFTAFIPSNMEYIVDKEKVARKDKEYMKELEELEEMGIDLVNVIGVEGEQIGMDFGEEDMRMEGKNDGFDFDINEN